MPGRNESTSCRAPAGQVYAPARPVSGRGPTRLISPFEHIPQLRQFVELGRPQPASRGASARVSQPSAPRPAMAPLAASYMVRNFRILKGLPFLPMRGPQAKTGPGDWRRMQVGQDSHDRSQQHQAQPRDQQVKGRACSRPTDRALGGYRVSRHQRFRPGPCVPATIPAPGQPGLPSAVAKRSPGPAGSPGRNRYAGWRRSAAARAGVPAPFGGGDDRGRQIRHQIQQRG